MFKTLIVFTSFGVFELVFKILINTIYFCIFSFSSKKVKKKKMEHFLFTQLCRDCKKSFKTFKISLTYYDDSGRFILSEEDAAGIFSFMCHFCKSLNVVDFDQIANPFTITYLRKENEINTRINEIRGNLLQLKLEKLKITN